MTRLPIYVFHAIARYRKSPQVGGRLIPNQGVVGSNPAGRANDFKMSADRKLATILAADVVGYSRLRGRLPEGMAPGRVGLTRRW
jgi:class 3 adenylate cyclase